MHWFTSRDNTRTEALEKAVEGLQKDMRTLKLEWEDVFDRINRIVGRLNARARTELKTDEDAPGRTILPSPAPPPLTPALALRGDLLRAARERHR